MQQTALCDWGHGFGSQKGVMKELWTFLLGPAGLFRPLAIWNAGHSMPWVFGLWIFGLLASCLAAFYEHEVLRLRWCASCLFGFALVFSLCGNTRFAQQQPGGCVSDWTWICVTPQRTPGGRLPWISRKGFAMKLLVVLFVGLLRVGEASHPGPSPQGSSCWTLGIANPSGLNGKLDQVNHLPGDAWILTETHLSQKGLSSFAKGLRMLHSPWKYMVPGAPCPPRSRNDTGMHSGVMFLSKFPARALPHAFDDMTYSSARIQVLGMAVADTWVTVGMLYGLPCNASHRQARYQTDALLAELVDRVACQTVGPRVIGGDFNYGPEDLEQVARLQALGFREAQDLRAWRHGCSVEPTGRGSKRIDQMWLSPELQAVYLGTTVAFDHWADHAAVSVAFAHDGLSVSVSAWPRPMAFPWPSGWNCQVNVDVQADLTVEYAKFWNQVESQAKLWAKHDGKQVLRAQCGRASVLEPRVVKEFLCPIKKGRKGDLQPAFMGVSLQHARFFRQLRRLQCLCRLLKKGIASWNSQVNRDETWRAVRSACGFPGGFGVWWQSHGLVPVLTHPLPFLCPDLDFAQGLFDGFHAFFTRYEADLIKHRYQASKQRRASSLAYVFQDCKDDPLPQADTLLDRVEVGIEEIRHDDSSMVLVRPAQLLDAFPVVVNGQVIEVVAHSEDQVWVTSVDGLEAGMILTQERAVASDAAILERFAAVWSSRWMKHSHVLPGQWDQICGFLEKTAKPIQWTCAPWTAARFQQAVRHKKPKAAKGPDGVSQPDLASLPLEGCQVFADIFSAVEAGARWPIQLASGFVSSLAKTPQAQRVDEFRPVVVYSLPYRVWSSERAREALHAVAPLLPNSVQGGVPLRHAKSIWYELAASLELAYLNQQGLHGLLMDIQKCFNNIPRQPLWCVLNLLGFPLCPLRAWASFVSGQTRRFRVRRSVGAPLSSNCGLPEGCALSVFGMTVVDWILDWWLAALDVRVDLRTFVDDWGVMFQDAGSFPRIWAAMEDFTGQMDLAIDMSKTRLWSTEADARKLFRNSDVAVTLAARNLGAHQNFSRHCHNACLQARLMKMPPIWIRLRASHGPYRFKIMALHMMAWPRALHGISVVHLGANHFKPLRAGALRALKADRKGANPFLHLVTSALQSDPEAWSTLQSLRDVRDHGCLEHVESLLGLFAHSVEKLPTNGPTAILLNRLMRLGWGVGGQGLVQDRFGSFSLMTIAWDELVLRVKLAWGHVLATELAHRSTFNGLSDVDLPELHRVLSGFGSADLVFLRCHLDGTLFTQNGRAKFQEGTTSKCPWCDERDGFHHRAWVCPFFSACRSHVTGAQWRALSQLPSCLVDHGWPLVLPEWEVLSRMFLQGDGLCRMSPVGLAAISSAQLLELFMDGTCAYPREVKLRFAAWSVTIASTSQNTLDNKLLMGGYVSGLCQTAFRAELTAALHAVTWAIQHDLKVRLWCDCQSVVRGVLRVLRGRPIRKNAPHSDLWLQLQQVLAGHEHQVQIRKVVSHGMQSRADDPVEQWVYWHNNLTDKAAEEINFRRPPEFWSAWTALKTAMEFHRPLHLAILKVLLQTSKMAVASQGKKPVVVAAVQEPVTQMVVPAVWEIPKKILKRYGETNLAHLHRWWTEWGPQMLQGTNKLVYISGIQLFYSFNLHTGFEGPWCSQKKWYSALADVPLAGRKPWGERSKNFLLMLKSYWKGNGLIVPTRMTRPSSAALAKWTISYRLRWSPSMIDRIDQIVLQQMGRQVCNQSDMALLEAAKTS